jgi:hypothetical protein
MMRVMQWKAVYKGFALAIEKTDYGWKPHVVTPTGKPMSEVAPGPKGQTLTSPRFIAYAPHLTLDEAKGKACREATLRVDGVEKSCAEAGIEWVENTK